MKLTIHYHAKRLFHLLLAPSPSDLRQSLASVI
jgi:hypothetical protein